MKALIQTPLLICLLVGVKGASQAEGNSKSPGPANWAQPIDLAGVPNLHKVSDTLYRSAQPTAQGMKHLQAMGIETVMNLRSLHSDRDEIGNTGLGYEHIYMKAWHPEHKEIVRFLQIVTNPKRTPVLVHCQHGADRTGTLCALYRVVMQGWSKEEAIREMTDGGYGFHEVWKNLPKWIEAVDIAAVKKDAGITPDGGSTLSSDTHRARTVSIENEVLSVSIDTLGAELQSIRHRQTGREYMWQGDPTYWPARAPIMFPVNVRFKDERFTYRGTEYEMPRMGLAVQSVFEVLASRVTDDVTLRLTSSERTLRHYPFPFELDVTFRLDGNRLVYDFVVKNIGSQTMYFALGGHPGFACPLVEGQGRGDYQLTFSASLDVDRNEISDSLIQAKRRPFLQQENRLTLNDPRIPNGGMLLNNTPSRQIGVARRGEPPFISLDLGDFPNANLWTPPGVPYVCIEPMVAHHDLHDSPLAIEEKSHLVSLPAGRSKRYQFSIIVH